MGLVRETRGKRDLAQRLFRRKHEFLGSLDATFDHEGMRADAETLLEGTLEVPRTPDGRRQLVALRSRAVEVRFEVSLDALHLPWSESTRHEADRRPFEN